MPLEIEGTDPCWVDLHKKLLVERPDLCNKEIYLTVNYINFKENKKNILWIHESPGLFPDLIEHIKVHSNTFIENNTTVYTCVEDLFYLPFVKKIHPSFSSWIKNPIFMPTKTKLVSMISSSKNFIKGHAIRHAIINQLPYCIDLYGMGFNYIDDKKDGLVDYCFSVAIENDNTNLYFTEKLLDCFLTCTIPIYWGAPKIGNICDSNGIIFLNNPQDICNLTYTDYISKIKSVEQNYYTALENNISPFTSLIKILEKN
jgi:hypothetical protein